MQTQPLVSIITPGYNCGAVVHRLLDSILAQTWQNIEFIFVNDGSTDNTAEVLESYREKFETRGISMTVLYQENQGQAIALGNGLQYFTGEYLCWCDSDDYLESDAIACRLEALNANSQYAMVAGQTRFVDCESLECKAIHGPASDASLPDRSFMSILQDSEDAYYCCGAYMIRAEAFLETNPVRYIYPSRGGQNIQMLLPNFFHRGIFVLNKPIYNYVMYPDSHSHTKRTKEQLIARFEEINTIRIQTLRHMDIPADERERYEYISQNTLHKACLKIGFEHRDKALVKEQRRILKKRGAYSTRDAKYYLETVSQMYRLLIRIYRKFRSFIKR